MSGLGPLGVAVVIILIAMVLVVLVGRIANDTAPWLGTWKYEIAEEEVVVSVRMPLGIPLPARHVPFSAIERVERVGEPGPVGPTLPWRVGRKRLLGSLATPNTVDLYRRGWLPPVVLTPPDADGFAQALRIALIDYRAERDPAGRGSWYTRQS